jgi:hypothetical protein
LAVLPAWLVLELAAQEIHQRVARGRGLSVADQDAY